ncbi:uncharacterized protein LOC142236821 [Haematobia irritans]|uniref:uncharacterized protein LOC142236821 n=1 Tax=Haematobia irritans TaxID=7368 RepID=UPI003F4F47A1
MNTLRSYVESTTPANASPQLCKVQIHTIDSRWKHLEQLCDAAMELLPDSVTATTTIHEDYEKLVNLILEKLTSLQVIVDSANTEPAVHPTSHSSVTLPKITIPKFDGDYGKWCQFYDLFLTMVHNTSIPAIQKMWYLKSHVVGEAERLISHLTTTEANYNSAWSMLRERYDNKRVIVATLIDKILAQPNATSNAITIKGLHDTTRECLLALNNVGVETSSWDPIVVQILIRKLDRNLHIRFEQSLQNPKETPKIETLLKFLEHQFQTMDSVSQKDRNTSTKAVSSIVTKEKINSKCAMCGTIDHMIYMCEKFKQLSEADRVRFAQSRRLCFNCLKSGHASHNCKGSSCRKCGKKHNSLLHIPIKSEQTTILPNVPTVSSAAAETFVGREAYAMLATARVIIQAPNGIKQECVAILDSGSQINIISERLIQNLCISPMEASLDIDGVGQTRKRATHRVNVKMASTDGCYITNLEAYILPTIIPPQPNHHIDISEWGLPPHIKLANPQFNKQSKIDILLGAEFFFTLMQPGTIKLSENLPVLQNTALGWIVGGSLRNNNNERFLSTPTCAVFDSDKALDEAIERLWKIDEVEPTSKSMSTEENLCEAHFAHHVAINKSGRFVVSLPFREIPQALGDSYTMAYNRFMSLERRLLKNSDLRAQYVQFMKEYESLGHMHRVKIDDLMDPKYFIPHHCVLKPDSTTTKLRVVFDASAKTSTGLSLNDLMYTGPVVQSDLFTILLRFRFPKYVFTTDIEKMYRQILIHPIAYGTRAAPYLATKCLQKIAVDNAIKYPYGSKMLKDNFYVDDGLGGSDNINIAITTQNQLIQMLKEYGFNLKKWCANHPRLLKDIPEADQEVNLDFDVISSDTVKTLGLFWLPHIDNFCVKVKFNEHKTVTRRTATSDLAKLFDPLGLLAPAVVTAKIFMQNLCEASLGWDDPLPESFCSEWKTLRNNIYSLNNFKMPRHLFNGDVPKEIQLHVFADASEKAYGAVAYIRASFKDSRITVRLLCAKSRVSPLKRQTLPRLELCAAVVAAELANRVRVDLNIQNESVYLWTDSEIVLSWINAQSSSLKTFVANRVSTIQSLSIRDQWRHLWFHGPLFLHGKESLWPQKYNSNLAILTDVEKKATISTAVEQDAILYKVHHGGSFKRLQRIIGYIFRFMNNTRIPKHKRSPHISLTPKELDESLYVIIRRVQRSDFYDEIKQLQKSHEVDRRSCINALSPYLDSKGIIRVGGRLGNSDLHEDVKQPMVLPYNDPITKLLFISLHEENKHCGPQALLNTVRQRFWPVKGKITARSVVQKCVR